MEELYVPYEGINLMPLSVFNKMRIGVARLTTITLQLAGWSLWYPQGKIEDELVKIDKFVFVVDFIIMGFNVDEYPLILLGRHFLSMWKTLNNVEKGELTMRISGQHGVI